MPGRTPSLIERVVTHPAFLLALFWLVIILAGASIGKGQEWDWSPKSVHQAAAVQVVCGRNGGSGLYLQDGPLVGVLTAKHVANREIATVKFSDGTNVKGSVLTDQFADLAWISVEHPSVAPLYLACKPPKENDRVELLAWGGPKDKLRRHWGIVDNVDPCGNCGRVHDVAYSPPVISGDSGGAVLNERHQLVGVIAHGHSAKSMRRDWNTYKAPVAQRTNRSSRLSAGCVAGSLVTLGVVVVSRAVAVAAPVVSRAVAVPMISIRRKTKRHRYQVARTTPRTLRLSRRLRVNLS